MVSRLKLAGTVKVLGGDPIELTCVPDAVQRVGGAPLIRDLSKCKSL
jgi:hypothetical protein